MADDLKVRIVWSNDEASLRAAMAQAQQQLQQVTGNVGYGNVNGIPTPATIGAQGGIRAAAPNTILGPNGQPVGQGQTITAPPPTYTASGGGAAGGPGANMTATTGTGTSFAAQVGNAPAQPQGNRGSFMPKPRLAGVFGYFGRYTLLRETMSTFGAIGEAAQQQQAISDMNRRVGDGIQKWKEFENQIMQVGVGLGATRQQMIELTNTFVSAVGKMGTNGQTTAAVRSSMELAKTMGVAPEVTTGFESRSAQFLQGPNTDFNKLGTTLYMAVQAGMRGREEEVVKAIESLEEIVGSRLPDLGDLGGISALMTTMSATGVQGLMGARGAQVAGNLDQFLQGKGAAAGNIMLMRNLAQTASANGEPTDIIHLTRAMEGGINNPLMLKTLKNIFNQTSGQGPDVQAFLLSSMGMGISQNQALKLAPAIQGMDIDHLLSAQRAGTLPGLELSGADKNTEAMADLGRATQELGETIIPALTEADKALAGELRGVAGMLGGLSNQMKVLGALLGVLGPALGLSSMFGLNPMNVAQGIGSLAGNSAATGAFAAGGKVFAAGGGMTALGATGAVGAGLLAGGLGSLLFDKIAHPNEPTTLDMLLQLGGVQTPWSQLPHKARGGIADHPQVAMIGEGGPEMVMPLNRNDKGALRALARQVAAAYGLDPDIFERQINQESGFNAMALGDSGSSYGLGQINRPSHPDFFSSGDPYDPVKNLNYAARLLSSHLSQYGDYRDALAAYNAGGGNIGAGFGYADKILGGSNVSSGGGAQVMNHHLTIDLMMGGQHQGKYSIDLGSPYRGVLTSPNWGTTA